MEAEGVSVEEHRSSEVVDDKEVDVVVVASETDKVLEDCVGFSQVEYRKEEVPDLQVSTQYVLVSLFEISSLVTSEHRSKQRRTTRLVHLLTSQASIPIG